MESELSIQIVWPLAAQEAMAAEFENIEPSHLFLGTLKFAELEERHFEQLVRDQTMIRPLVSERDDLRSQLSRWSLPVPDKSRKIRYSLRKRIGKGGRRYESRRLIHRSKASRKIFEKAENAARQPGAPKWFTVNLLDALLDDPSPKIKDVLAKAGCLDLIAAKKTPNLDRYGQDLTGFAFRRRSQGGKDQEADTAKDPVCKVLIDDILQGENTNVLLIQKGGRTPGEIVESIAQYFSKDSSPSEARSKRVVKIEISADAWRTGNVSHGDLENRMGKLFEEAMDAGNVILFFNDIHKYRASASGANLMDALKQLLSKKKTQCLMGIDEDNYQKHMTIDTEWKKLFRTIWIHDLKAAFQL